MSDEQLLIASLKDPRLFGVLVDRYKEPFRRRITRMLGSVDEAEDVVQETFVKIYIQAKRFENRGAYSFRAWAYTVLIRTALSFIRKLKRERLATIRLDQELSELLADPEDRFRLYLLKDEVMSIISRLPAAVRRLITLRFLDGLSYQEIASLEGLSEGAVRTRLSRARKQFIKTKMCLESETCS